MKKFTLFLSLLIASFAIYSFVNSPPEELALNAAIPQADLKMKDVSGKSVSLNDIKTAKGLLVIFSCNT